MKRLLCGVLFCITVLAVIVSFLAYYFRGENINTRTIYSLNQFDAIEISISTIEDVRAVAHIETMYVTSFGGVAEFQANDGNWIQIKFYGPELVVGSIEIVDSPWAEGIQDRGPFETAEKVEILDDNS